MKDRRVAAVVVSAVGDALGAGYEFGLALPPDTPVLMAGGGPFRWTPGEWTDDTQLAAGVLAGVRPGAIDLSAIGEAFLRLYESDPPDLGNQTRAVFSTAEGGGDLARAAVEYRHHRPDAAGNGSLMRTAPIPLAFPGQAEEIAAAAAEVSALTHAHLDCQAACMLWSVAIDRLASATQPGPPDGGWVELVCAGIDHLPVVERTGWRNRLDEVDGAPASAFAAKNGWVVDALRCALAAIVETPVTGDGSTHVADALRHAVRQGNDTDTVAAIAGALLGAAWGVETVPAEWLDPLHGLAPTPTAVERIDGGELAARATAAGGGAATSGRE